MVRFVRDNPRLLMLEVECEKQHNPLKFSKKSKELFADLVKERNGLTVKVLFLDDDREVEISENGFSKKKPTAPTSEGNEQDMMSLLGQMIAHFNRDLPDFA